MLLLRDEVQGKIMDGSKDWNIDDIILFSALSGCDFVPRLYRTKADDIESFMSKWKNPENEMSLDDLLQEFAQGKRWPSGNGKAGAPADANFVGRIHKCMGLMKYAPVIAAVEGGLQVVPLRPLPPGKAWTEVIGFDPHEHFSDKSISEAYGLKIWARTGMAFPKCPQPLDPTDSSSILPHESIVDFSENERGCVLRVVT